VPLHPRLQIADSRFQRPLPRDSAIRNPPPAIPFFALLLALGGLLALSAKALGGDDWWNPAWSHRKKVRVRLAPQEPLGFRIRPPSSDDDTVAAQADIQCEVPLAAGASREIRVVDAGGNVLPCVVDEPDKPGHVRVVFPARRTIAAQLATPIQDATKTVTLSVGRDKAVLPGARFYALAGPTRIATLEVETVDAKTSSARVVDKTTPNIAQGIPVESDVLTAADYWVYYGNPNPQGDPPRWTPPTATIRQHGWRLTDGQFLALLEEARGYRMVHVDRLRAAMRNSPRYVGATTHTIISNSANPLSYDSDFHVSAYEATVHCAMPGLWRFSVDSAAPAYLFLDGKLTAQRPSFFYQVAGNFEHRGKIDLAEGYHHLVLCAVETAKHNTRLAWQAPNATVFSLIPPNFFVNRVVAETVAFETHAQRHQVFFSCRPAPLSVLADNGARYQSVRFHNLTPQPPNATEGPEAPAAWGYLWDFGDGTQSREAEPCHLYQLPAGGGPAHFTVALHLSSAGKAIGHYQQLLRLDPRPTEKLNISLDIVSFANVVYYDERTSIAVRLRNTSFSPIVVRAIARLHTRNARQVILNQELPIEGKNENFCVLPIDMKQLDDKTALLELDVLFGGRKVLDTAARIVPFSSLIRRGQVTISAGEATLGPGGPYTGMAWTGGDFPTTNYEARLRVRRLAGQDFAHVTFPVGDAYCTLRPRGWTAPIETGRWHTLRLHVGDARVEAWLDEHKVTDVSRAAAPTALPLAFAALKPFGVHASSNTCLAVREIALARFDAPPTPKAPQGAAPAQAPPRRPPTEWVPLFEGAARGWKAVADSDLNLLRRGLGALHDHEGRRVMISTEIEDADRHLEWVFARYLREKVITRRSVLLLGDRMSNQPEPGKSFTDYVAILQERLKAANRPFHFIERNSGLLPTLADVVLLTRSLQALAEANELPDILVVCPGLGDVAQAVGDRDFARSFDLMIDAVRATGKPIKTILVSPPPYPRNVHVSRLYTEAAERIARDHHVGFLNLHDLLAADQGDWVRAHYAVPEADGMYFENPNEAAHRRIADAIEKLIAP